MKRRERHRREPTRPDALVIMATGELSYADMLRKVKAEPSLKELGENVDHVRKTAKGDVLLQLKKTADAQTSDFQQKVETILVRTAASIANKALAAGKVRIGWVNCRLREKPDLKRCYRCLGYGHHASDCKSEDRSEYCYRCGEKGHKAKDCSSEPECMLSDFWK